MTHRIVECRIDGRIAWLLLLHATATHGVVQEFDGSEIKLLRVRRRELHLYDNAVAINV